MTTTNIGKNNCFYDSKYKKTKILSFKIDLLSIVSALPFLVFFNQLFTGANSFLIF